MTGREKGNAANLQPGQILLHIGVHKTGTTAIQDALAHARPELHEWNVQYPGTAQAHRNLASSAMDRRLGWKVGGAAAPDPSLWENFVKSAHKFPGITVCSSEFFAESDDAKAREIIERIGKENVHIVVTLRNFGQILPSAWQQILKSGYENGYIHWLNNVLNAGEKEPKSEVFWTRHRHDIVVERWAKIVGSDRVTVVVVDDANRDGIYTDFELLLGLPKNSLLKHRTHSLNRSMTAAESELLRCLNEAVGGSKGWRPYGNAVHDGLIKGMVEGRTPDAGEAKLQTPQWALDMAARYAATYVDAIKASGVNVVGNLEVLGTRLEGPEEVKDRAIEEIPVNAAVAAILGAMSDVFVPPRPTRMTQARSKAARLRRAITRK
ncbi:MAG: hypothetical protein F2923_00615 [Actinobacteria bacterium]|uniref:Unannotated protein n=1 Tax=freshwater metagenome TaxID=449393 RepID=A0A6J7F9N5_9ZZZZ|nr:hypothetical protein [Actinomycetota bacterium]MTB27122.1 hypothetical protein [Actinomycetota bacterium]